MPKVQLQSDYKYLKVKSLRVDFLKNTEAFLLEKKNFKMKKIYHYILKQLVFITKN